jgi:hypothetical protein
VTKPQVRTDLPGVSTRYVGPPSRRILWLQSQVWRRDFKKFRLLNLANVTLLLKMEGAAQAKDFRPISLIHIFAKLITNILANRLDVWLEGMVSTDQSAFIKG